MNVQEVDLNNKKNREQVLFLLREAFGSFSDERFQHIVDECPLGIVSYGVYEHSQLIAFNCFIAHSVHRGGMLGIAYQSCLTVTRQDHKGKGLFSKIINFAKTDLKHKGGAFIFGFPNMNSGPIFVNKLGFSLSKNISSIIIKLPIGSLGTLNTKKLLQNLNSEELITFDYRETAIWKKNSLESSFFEYDNLTNYIFGSIVTRKIGGKNLKILAVGGVEINKPYQINSFLLDAIRKSESDLLRIVSNISGPISKSSLITRGKHSTEPLITYSLNWDVDASFVEAMTGLKDVY